MRYLSIGYINAVLYGNYIGLAIISHIKWIWVWDQGAMPKELLSLGLGDPHWA